MRAERSLATTRLRDIQIVPFAQVHLAGAWCLSREAGWPHRTEDWALALSLSDGVVALDGEEVVGTAMATVFGDVVMLNMIIVAAGMRGRGLGRRLMDEMMARAAGREMRLVATSDGMPLYRKMGFVEVGEIVQHQGIACAAPSVPLNVAPGGPQDVGRLAAMDAKASRLERARLLRAIAETGEVLLAARGFAMLRRFGRGLVLGPLVAADDQNAQALMVAAAARHVGAFLRVDLPRASGLGPFAESLGLARAGAGMAMVCPGDASLRPRSVGASYTTYALASQALG